MSALHDIEEDGIINFGPTLAAPFSTEGGQETLLEEPMAVAPGIFGPAAEKEPLYDPSLAYASYESSSCFGDHSGNLRFFDYPSVADHEGILADLSVPHEASTTSFAAPSPPRAKAGLREILPCSSKAFAPSGIPEQQLGKVSNILPTLVGPTQPREFQFVDIKSEGDEIPHPSSSSSSSAPMPLTWDHRYQASHSNLRGDLASETSSLRSASPSTNKESEPVSCPECGKWLTSKDGLR
jgi:hypothetical protein